MVKPCGEVLYANGDAVAFCCQEYGVEHSHDDPVAIQLFDGRAMPLLDGMYVCDVLVLGQEIAQINVRRKLDAG